LPCGCMAMGTRRKLNRDSLTIKGGQKVCRHGTVWDLAWTSTGEVNSRRVKSRPGSANVCVKTDSEFKSSGRGPVTSWRNEP
jgi:hypothetical protein